MPGLGLLRLVGHITTAKGFAGLVAGIIAIIAIPYWTRWFFYHIYRKSEKRSGPPSWALPFIVSSRHMRKLLLRRVPGFKSGGHAAIVLVYIAANIVLSLTNLPNYNTGNSYAGRFGWMISLNMCATVFLSLKNTPLAYVTPYSYERINILHKTAGIMTTFWVIAHPLVWLGAFVSSNSLSAFRQQEQIYGAIAGVSFLILGPVAAMFRLISYELFYVTHVTFVALAIIMTALHRPEFAYKTIIVTIVTGALWAADKLFRWTRFLLYSINNTATLTPLPNGGTRVELAKTPIGAAPGKHIFLWIPGVQPLQMHPFSIVGTHPLELVINSYSGFTKALHKKALENPGIVLKASMEGPYGKFPDPLDYDKIVLIAGGSGGSFTFGLAVNALERMTAESRQEIEFVWAVRETDHLAWYQDHLKTVLTHEHAPKVKASLHITQGDPEKPPTWESTPVASALSSRTSVDQMSRLTFGEVDEEKSPTPQTTSPASSVLLAGRPDVAAQIRDAVRTTAKDKRILVAACGPSSLMTVVRNTTASCIQADGPSIEMHLEQFGW